MLRGFAALVFLCLLVEPGDGFAAEVDARLSSGQAYVGSPITLQIIIEDVEKYEAPQIPEVDGLAIESTGGGRRSSQTVIINGRMSSTQSVVLQYKVTAQREGTFEIPPLTVSVDGQTVKTSPLGFIGTRSEVGDLMYVEIEGKQDRVYVGEPLELVLKVWVQRYRDQEIDYSFSESDTWNSFSEATSWGPFKEMLEELRSRRKRPGGKSVKRKNDDGESKSYFLYEFEATSYPNKPGAIDASDVRIVFDYPVEMKLQRRRSPFDGFFGGAMDPAFEPRVRSRPVVSQSRPIVATASVDETEVIPIPLKDRPDSFQGAVGRYEIVANTDLRTVNAGDPITLQVGISGDGPLGSIQAPPLEKLSESFRLDGQPLAGFIRDGVKYFTTTIRPIDETVTEIPAIEMSYFDPKTETFETINTSAIEIEVKPAEKLAMDSIVGPDADSETSQATSIANGVSTGVQSWSPLSFLARNHLTMRTLEYERQSSLMDLAIWFYGLPLSLFVAFGLVRFRSRLVSLTKWFRSAKQTATNQLADIQSAREIPGILQIYVTDVFGQPTATFADQWQAALGQLRTQGDPELAADLESLAYRAERSSDSSDEKRALRDDAFDWIERAEIARSSQGARNFLARRQAKKQAGLNHGSKAVGLLLAGLLTHSMTSNALASTSVVLLDQRQQETLLREANSSYQEGIRANQEGLSAHHTATQKYQQLVDSGIQNGGLYANLANAYYRLGDTGRAIANYRLAMQFRPLDWRSQIMLVLAQAQTQSSIPQWHAPLFWLVIGVALWLVGLWMICVHVRQRNAVVAVVLLGLSLFCLAIVYQQTKGQPDRQAIAVASELTLYDGEGKSFEIVAELQGTLGATLGVLERRGEWLQVQSSDGRQGWVPSEKLVELLPRDS